MNTEQKRNSFNRYHMPAEWHQHDACWMAWPCRLDLWPDIDSARSAFAMVANAIIEFEPVSMLVNPVDEAHARKLLDPRIALYSQPIDDSWTRDSAPTFVIRSGKKHALCAVDWRFNGWGEKFLPYDKDAMMASYIAERLDVELISSKLTLEGGAIHVNGEGVLLTTRQCLLNNNRNLNWSQAQIETELSELLGVNNFIWLERGLVDDHTDGHIDELVCFCDANRLVALSTDDENDANFETLAANMEVLRKARNANGEPFEVHQIQQPEARYLADGSRMSLSYINYYHANDAIIMAAFDQSDYDSEAFQVIKRLYPQREIVQLNATAIFEGGGGIHCITQQQPALNQRFEE